MVIKMVWKCNYVHSCSVIKYDVFLYIRTSLEKLFYIEDQVVFRL